MRNFKPPHPASRALTAAGLLLSTPFLTMACSAIPVQETERIAEARLAYVPGQNNPACGADDCPTGQVRTCGDVCVTPVPLGNPCSQDDCESDSVCDPHFGASCMPIGTTQFLCALPPIGEALLSECDPTKNECPADLFCKNVGRCFPNSGLPSLCSVGVSEGHACDSNWDDAYVPGSPPSTSKCRPCMPGTTCLDGQCRKPCTTTDDCPCRDVGDQTTCVSNPAAGAACYVCHSLGEVCNADLKCCDPNTKCGLRGTCCKTSGQACTSQDDCCGGDDEERCLTSTGECGACIGIGQSCMADGDCCSDKCTGGECIPSCAAKEGKPCTVSGAKGECAKGTLHCEVTGALTCVQQIFPVTEVCNGKDDNCDGIVDNIEPAACQNADKLEGTVCQSGFESSGHTKCVDGKEICVAEAHKDFCAHCGGYLSDNTYCGACKNSKCDSTLCTPNHICVGPPNQEECEHDTNCPGPENVACWHPAQNGACCGSSNCTP